MTTANDIFYDLPAGDIYGNLPDLDEFKEMPTIEVLYQCKNCNSVMRKNVITDTQSKEPVKCLFCKLSVKPIEMN